MHGWREEAERQSARPQLGVLRRARVLPDGLIGSGRTLSESAAVDELKRKVPQPLNRVESELMCPIAIPAVGPAYVLVVNEGAMAEPSDPR